MYRRLLSISYKDHFTNEDVRRKIQKAIGKYDLLLALVKKRKLRWFATSQGLTKTILQSRVQGTKEKTDKRRGGKTILKRGRGWTLLAELGQLKTGLGEGIVVKSSVVPQTPSLCYMTGYSRSG